MIVASLCCCSSKSYLKEEHDLGVSYLIHVCSQIENLVVCVGWERAKSVLCHSLGLQPADVIELFCILDPDDFFCEWHKVYEMEQDMQTLECRLGFRAAVCALRSFSFVEVFQLRLCELSELSYIFGDSCCGPYSAHHMFISLVMRVMQSLDFCLEVTENDFAFAASVLRFLMTHRSLLHVKIFLEDLAALSGRSLFLFWNKLGLVSDVEACG